MDDEFQKKIQKLRKIQNEKDIEHEIPTANELFKQLLEDIANWDDEDEEKHDDEWYSGAD